MKITEGEVPEPPKAPLILTVSREEAHLIECSLLYVAYKVRMGEGHFRMSVDLGKTLGRTSHSPEEAACDIRKSTVDME